MVKKYIWILIIISSLAGCSYTLFSNAYPHLKKIGIEPFENQSSEFGLTDKNLELMTKLFAEDGRLKLVTQNPDCKLEGSITSFTEAVYSFDSANNVQDYQLRVVYSVILTDLTKNEVIYENKSLTISDTYSVSEASTSKNKSKEEALDEIVKSLFRTIIQNSLETW